MFDRTYYATHPDMMECVSNEELRDRYLIDGLFREGECVLNYTHADRFVIGGVAVGDAPVKLPTQTEPKSAEGHPFLERREMAVVNVGEAEGTLTVDGESFTLGNKDCVYVTMGATDVEFGGKGARFYIASCPAHKGFTTRKLGAYYLVGAFVVGMVAQRFRENLPTMSSEHTLHAVEVFASFFIPFYFFNAGLHLRPEHFSPAAFGVGLACLLMVGVRIGVVAVHRRVALGEHLAPASGGGAQVHRNDAGPEQAVALADLDQLERRPRPVAEALRLLHPMVGDVLVHPRLAETVLALAGIEHAGRSLASSARSHYRRPPGRRGATPSGRARAC